MKDDFEHEEPENVENVSYAGFWARFFAYMIDCIIVGCGLLVVRLFMAGVTAAVSGTALSRNLLFHYDLTDIVLYIAQVSYFILFTYYTGSTLGKRAMNLRVVCAEGKERFSFLNVVYRETIGRFLCGVTMGIGYLFAAVDKEKRGMHDMLCDTHVIYAKTVKVYPVYYGWNAKRVPRDVVQKGNSGGYRMVMPEEKVGEINTVDNGRNGLTEGNSIDRRELDD